MNRETITVVVVLAGLTSLFLWSIWAGFAGIGAIASWMLWLWAREAAEQRKMRQRCRAQLEQAFASAQARLTDVFYTGSYVSAIGVGSGARPFASISSEGLETFAAESVLESRVLRLSNGSYEIGLCVPGRVSGRPYWHTLHVKRRSEAERWARTVGPLLGERLRSASLD